MPISRTDLHAVIIGAGPAGLSAAYELSRLGVRSTILEADKVVGGLARTVEYKGYLFDIGGHRFFTKWDEINSLWREILGEKLLTCSRLSRIFYRRRFFHYPLKATDVLLGLGPLDSFLIIASYLKARVFRSPQEENLEQWVSNRFGQRLYETFFKTYTEKVWGVPCSEIRSEWAEQRIRGLSLTTTLKNAIFKPNSTEIKSLIESFHYPERGPGQMWQEMASRLQKQGNSLLLERGVTRIAHDRTGITYVESTGPHRTERHVGTHFISSMPIRELVVALDPSPPLAVLTAASRIRYRDFLIVSLIINRRDVMPDNWLYVHDPGVRVGRIQNFKNWSPAMVPDPEKTCLGMEYFVFENDDLWSMDDGELIQLASRELENLGLAAINEVKDGTVVRMKKAYPMYDSGYSDQIAIVRKYIESQLPNLQLIGRNGMHKYNNQDHSMMTGIYAARNVMGEQHDLWAINTEPEYHEVRRPAGGGAVRPNYAEPPRIDSVKQKKKSGSPESLLSD